MFSPLPVSNKRHRQVIQSNEFGQIGLATFRFLHRFQKLCIPISIFLLTGVHFMFRTSRFLGCELQTLQRMTLSEGSNWKSRQGVSSLLYALTYVQETGPKRAREPLETFVYCPFSAVSGIRLEDIVFQWSYIASTGPLPPRKVLFGSFAPPQHLPRISQTHPYVRVALLKHFYNELC